MPPATQAFWLALLLLGSTPACQRVRQKPLLPAPTFEGSKARAYSSPYASSQLDSQVFVPRRRFASVKRASLGSSGRSLASERLPPLSLVVSPNALHAVLNSAGWIDILMADGCRRTMSGGLVMALDDLIFVDGHPIGWNGAPVAENEFGILGGMLAQRVEAESYIKVWIRVDWHPHGGPPPSVCMSAAARKGDPSPTWSHCEEKHWGLGAIGGDASVVVALDDGTLQVYLPVPDDKLQPTLRAERNVGVEARWLSLVGSHIMLVSRDGAGSKLQALKSDTTPVYALTVPFEVLEPAIAGAGTRVYLAGKGLVALDDGKVTWTQTSAEPIYASTFEDGSLAVATGKRLDFVKIDGTVDQTFNTEEALVAPPAIAGDGSVWAASATALYVAR